MSNKHHSTTKRMHERFWFVQVVTLVLALPLLCLHHRWEHAADSDLVFLSIVAKEAGFAALVAFMLNLSVEWINRRRHADQEVSLVKLIDEKHQERLAELLRDLRTEHSTQLATLGSELEKKREAQTVTLLADLDKKYNETSTKLLKNVFQTVYERYIEPDVFKFIDTHILRRDIMRKGYTSSLTIRPMEQPNPENFVNLQFANSYKVINLTGNDLEDEAIISTIIDITPGYEDYCKFISASIDGKQIASDLLSESMIRSEEGAYCRLIVRGKVPKDKPVHVEIQYNKVGPRNFSEVICTTVQMDSFTMETVCHDPGLAIFAMSLHPESEVPQFDPINPEIKRWRMEHAIVPGQGIVVFWHPKRESTLLLEGAPEALPAVKSIV
ncbi:hypothetical protein CLU90_3320 [Janthinobacterium sp. 67]|uniref:hypothetical protein n=1 Tax=Janthinobacterium sp. 67 TaxID=2035207 RepID=UPI000C24A4C4|nr:hypothetical protein [Janthinobacterium sp. 67]PJJ20088.1 hypothetical protein CLU90_3320 [Janthinobacterium sp. 67]